MQPTQGLGQLTLLKPTDRDGFLWAARDFLKTLRTTTPRSGALLGPVFCAGHALEAALKAHLSGAGYPTSKIASKQFGHNLSKLWCEAAKAKLRIPRTSPQWCVTLNTLHRHQYRARYPLGLHGIQTPNRRQMITGVADVLAKVTKHKF